MNIIEIAPTKLPESTKKVSLLSLYKYSGAPEILLLIIGIISSSVNGATLPVVCVLIGSAINSFSPLNTVDEILDEVVDKCLLMTYIGIAALILGIVAEACWTVLGERLGIKVRVAYLSSTLNFTLAQYDSSRPQEFPARMKSLVEKYQDGIGSKVSRVVISLSMFVSGIVVAFIYGWQLALALLAIYPLTVFIAQYAGAAKSKGEQKIKQGYGKCAGYVEEALGAIKTVFAFCAEEFEKQKYLNELGKVEKVAIKSSLYLGLSVGLVNMSISLAQGLGYLVGSYFVQYEVYNAKFKEPYNVASVITVFFAELFAMFSLGMITPQLQSIGEARIAASEIYETISCVDKNPIMTKGVEIPSGEFKGHIEFKNVTFAYPSKPDVKVLNNFSMVFESGKMTGICGETGSGKSTVIQLLERFYEPNAGSIEVDGYDICKLDLRWWRQQIGYVDQEPVLFNTTIKENLFPIKDCTTDLQITSALDCAYASEFVNSLPKKAETEVGSYGGQLSGGQKQRLAVARALVKQPRVLLLDEATSALDGISEGKVQESVFRLLKEKGVTAIVVAHRLSTIKAANKIVVVSKGELAEVGTDQELRENNGIYASMRTLQEGAEEIDLNSVSECDIAAKLEETTGGALQQDNRQLSSATLPTTRSSSAAETATPSVKERANKAHAGKVWAESWKHKYHLVLGIVLALISGYNMPVAGMLFGMVSMDMLLPDKSLMRYKVNLDFVGFIVNGVSILGVSVLMFWLFGYIAAKATHRLRAQLYDHILRLDVSWFGRPGNFSLALGSVLEEATEDVGGVVKVVACSLIQSASSLVIALAIGFAYSYRMAAITLACIPVMAISGAAQTRFQVRCARKRKELYKKSMEILSESVRNFRTVLSFSNEERAISMYKVSLLEPLKEGQKMAVFSGLLFGVSQLLPLLVYALLFYLAALFLVKYEDDPRDTFVTVYALFFSAISLGQMQQYTPEIGRASASLSAVYGILDEAPEITSPAQPVTTPIRGRIEFRDVAFKYPSRSELAVRKLNLTIEAGQKVTIVGPSGSGKSTLIQLLLRFYDASEGAIFVDGVNIKDYSLSTLRKSLGYVSQEPCLFDDTIEGNVRYGRKATADEVAQACSIAGALELLEDERARSHNLNGGENLPGNVGAKGSMLSGGQKQRIAIARAVLDNPQILLLDEATSALDSATETEVQRAINDVSLGRTTVSIAHRLGCVGDADTIIVVENGTIVECGNKQKLMRNKGCFYKLYEGFLKQEQNKDSPSS